jgi:hypothetical protein
VHTSHSSFPNFAFIDIIRSLMGCSNTKNMFPFAASMTLTRGTCVCHYLRKPRLSPIRSLFLLHNFRYETISDLMNLQDQIDSFQKMVFAHFRGSINNECRISALVPLVKESYGIYRFITSMLRAMHRRESLHGLLSHYTALLM